MADCSSGTDTKTKRVNGGGGEVLEGGKGGWRETAEARKEMQT